MDRKYDGPARHESGCLATKNSGVVNKMNHIAVCSSSSCSVLGHQHSRTSRGDITAGVALYQNVLYFITYCIMLQLISQCYGHL